MNTYPPYPLQIPSYLASSSYTQIRLTKVKHPKDGCRKYSQKCETLRRLFQCKILASNVVAFYEIKANYKPKATCDQGCATEEASIRGSATQTFILDLIFTSSDKIFRPTVVRFVHLLAVLCLIQSKCYVNDSGYLHCVVTKFKFIQKRQIFFTSSHALFFQSTTTIMCRTEMNP